MSNQKYYIVSAEALPEVFIKVAEARRMLQVGEAATVGEAARLRRRHHFRRDQRNGGGSGGHDGPHFRGRGCAEI